MSAQWYDANISIPGCDKNMPGCLIAMGRLNRFPHFCFADLLKCLSDVLQSQAFTDGLRGDHQGWKGDVRQISRQSLGYYLGLSGLRRGPWSCVFFFFVLKQFFNNTNTAGTISEKERIDVIEHACPGPGACGGMYTANTSEPVSFLHLLGHSEKPLVFPLPVASAIEALGMTLPYSSCTPAEDSQKIQEW